MNCISTSTLCPNGHNVQLSQPYGARWQATCDCYDGAEDAGPQLFGHGASPDDALDAFVEQAEERDAIEYWPNDLAFQVRAESKLSAGWRVIDGLYQPTVSPTTTPNH
jgi:hypothetical protein